MWQYFHVMSSILQTSLHSLIYYLCPNSLRWYNVSPVPTHRVGYHIFIRTHRISVFLHFQCLWTKRSFIARLLSHNVVICLKVRAILIFAVRGYSRKGVELFVQELLISYDNKRIYSTRSRHFSDPSLPGL